MIILISISFTALFHYFILQTNKGASQTANSPELKLSLGNAGSESVILRFRIRERTKFKDSEKFRQDSWCISLRVISPFPTVFSKDL